MTSPPGCQHGLPRNLVGNIASTFGSFLKWGYPQIIYFKRKFQYKNNPFWVTPIHGNPHVWQICPLPMKIMKPFLRPGKCFGCPPLEAEDHIAGLHQHTASFFDDMCYVLSAGAAYVLAIFQPSHAMAAMAATRTDRPCGHSWMGPGRMISIPEINQICRSVTAEGLRDGHDLQEILWSCQSSQVLLETPVAG